MARLIVIDGPDLGNEYELERPDSGELANVILGRDPRVEVPLQDSAISREHCRVEISPGGCRLVDLGSRNKTFLNGDPVEQSWLKDGDLLVIGDSELRFEDEAQLVEVGGVASTIIKEIEPCAGSPSRIIGRLANPTNGATETDENADAIRDTISGMERIVELSRRIAGATSSADLFDDIFATVVDTIRADHGAFLVRDGKRWVARAQSKGPEALEAKFLASLAVVQRVADEGKALLSTSEDDGTTKGAGRKNAAAAPLYSVAVPVLGGEKVTGILYFDRRAIDEPFSEDVLEYLQIIAEPLGGVLERLDEQVRLIDENRNLMRSISETRRIIGSSEPMREVLDFIRRAAPTPMTVLIQGETGTGKELVSSALHYGSPRRGRPFVAINCAALPENLIESELFGHERGAFTGAVARKKGRFELANGGTVFLDELGEMTLACQAKLLRLLEEKRFERVGGVDPVEVDVRIIAATNKDLLEEVEKKEFREDLYYRLGVLQVKLPPLRERPDDIVPLAEHFLAAHAEGGRPKKISASAEKKLMRYSWPGNVRQLRNVVESALVLGDSREIKPDDLILPERKASAGNGEAWEPISLQELEKRHVLRTLEHTKGNKKRASELLGIERCTLYSKLKNYEV